MSKGNQTCDKSGRDFEHLVAEAYEALGYRVTHNVEIGGRQTDISAEKEIPGAASIHLAIECKDYGKAVGVKMVDEFSHRTLAQTASGAITSGVLVSRKGFTPSARTAAEAQKLVTLLSLEELTSLIFDVRLRLRQLSEEYETLEIFQDYMQLKVEVQQWSTGLKSSEPQAFDGLMEQMMGFDGENGIGVMIVLADFGAGKTTLLQNIEYHRAKAHLTGEDTRLPLFVQLRNFRESHDIGALLQASFHETYYRELPLGVLWQRIESGRFYLLLDGFDEMVDRSDASRRLELFQALMPLLRSSSPVMLTSRSSYLVERGELQALLQELRAGNETAPGPIGGGTQKKVSAEHLRRKLYERMREERRPPGGKEPLDAKQVRVVRLQELDAEQVKEFVARHASELDEVGTSVPEVLDFMERTYDLSDLATRPMLLRLIVSTVIEGGLDLTDSGTQYGASGLYEMYTHAKLEVDVDKLPGRDGGLEVDTRRALAESLALEMYRNESLEADFQEHLAGLLEGSEPLGRRLQRSGLSEAEITTDLAARSFVTLDRHGVCRFIHKSFRGFFVARVLKDALPELTALSEEAFEDEVLYFLGGFAPTEPGVEKQLWQAFKDADLESTTLRRNLVVGYLHTKPDHGTRRIEEVAIFEAEFGQLEFTRTPMKNVVWRDATIRRLIAVKATWSAIRFEASQLQSVLVEGGEVEVALNGSNVDQWSVEAGTAVLAGADTTIDVLDIEGSKVDCTVGEGLVVKNLVVVDATMTLSRSRTAPRYASIGNARIDRSILKVWGETFPEKLEAVDCLILLASNSELPSQWALRKSVLLLPWKPGPEEEEKAIPQLPSCDRWSLILAPKGVHNSLLRTSAGIFGSLLRGPGEMPPFERAGAWGVLEAEDTLEAVGVPKSVEGCRINRLLLLREKPYRTLLKGELNAVRQLQALAAGGNLDFCDADSVTRFHSLRKQARSQYDEVKSREWPDLFDYLKRSRRDLKP